MQSSTKSLSGNGRAHHVIDERLTFYEAINFARQENTTAYPNSDAIVAGSRISVYLSAFQHLF